MDSSGGPCGVFETASELSLARGTPEQVRHFFFEVAAQIAHRIDLFCGLPDPKLDALEVVLIGEKCKI